MQAARPPICSVPSAARRGRPDRRPAKARSFGSTIVCFSILVACQTRGGESSLGQCQGIVPRSWKPEQPRGLGQLNGFLAGGLLKSLDASTKDVVFLEVLRSLDVTSCFVDRNSSLNSVSYSSGDPHCWHIRDSTNCMQVACSTLTPCRCTNSSSIWTPGTSTTQG